MTNRTIESEIAWHVAQIRADLIAMTNPASYFENQTAVAYDRATRGAYQTIIDDIEYRAKQRAEKGTE